MTGPAGVRTLTDRPASLADPDTRPIRKGKPRHPAPFDCAALMTEGGRGFAVDIAEKAAKLIPGSRPAAADSSAPAAADPQATGTSAARVAHAQP